MRKFFIPVFLCILAACAQVELDTPQGYKVLTIQATKSEDPTKTAYAGETTFSWCVGDKISVICNDGSANCWQTFTATTAAATSSFTATVPDGVNLGPMGSDYKVAMYPACNDHVYTDTWNLKYNIPAERDFRAASGGHQESAIPMIAWGTDEDTYAFSNLTGAAKFSFTGVPCSAVKMTYTVPAVKLNGTFSLIYEGGSIDKSNSSNVFWNVDNAANESEKTVTYYADVTDGNVSFYLPYGTGGIWGMSTLRLSDAATDATLYNNTSVGDINIVKNRITVLPTLDLGYTTTKVSFTESSGEVSNPERGMMSYSKFVFENDAIPSVKNIPLDYTGESLAFMLFYLTDYMNKDLDDDAKDFISTEFDKVRAANKKAVVRFAYEETHVANAQHEATPTQVLKHVDQVADILSANADILYMVQAGWLGTYGEWYYKTNNNGETKDGYTDYYLYTKMGSTVTDLNDNHKNLLDRMLLKVPSPVQIGLRTAFYKRYYLSPDAINTWTPITSWGTDANDRLAFFNDGIRGSDSDVGTFNSQTDLDMWYSQGNWLACGGEMSYRSADVFAALSDDLKDCDQSIAEMRRQHLSYLHYSESNRFMAKWISEGRMEDLKKMLGYRLVLGDVSLGYLSLDAGQTVAYSIKIKNTGCAPVIYPRPFKLVLLHGGTPTVLKDLGDIREIAPGDDFYNLSGSFDLPAAVTAGDKLAIWLPDNASGLQSNAAYSIRLANAEVSWESGYNVIHTF